MIYAYSCDRCQMEFDVVKPAADSHKEEKCIQCDQLMSRLFKPFYIVGAKNEFPEFNPGLDCVVRNKYHRAEICKERNLIEIGNEKPTSIHAHAEKTREEKHKKSWDEV